MIRSLGERNFDIYTIDLDTGAANPIQVDGQMRESLTALPWEDLAGEHIAALLHESYRGDFIRQFSLAGLRKITEEGSQRGRAIRSWLFRTWMNGCARNWPIPSGTCRWRPS